jgi:uncharacterized protein (DUF2461 family)
MRIKTTKRNVVWSVQKKVQQKQGGGTWRTVVDSLGPILVVDRQAARDIANVYRADNKRSKFRINRVTIQ